MKARFINIDIFSNVKSFLKDFLNFLLDAQIKTILSIQDAMMICHILGKRQMPSLYLAVLGIQIQSIMSSVLERQIAAKLVMLMKILGVLFTILVATKRLQSHASVLDSLADRSDNTPAIFIVGHKAQKRSNVIGVHY